MSINVILISLFISLGMFISGIVVEYENPDNGGLVMALTGGGFFLLSISFLIVKLFIYK